MKSGTAAAPVADKLLNVSDCSERILTIVYRLQQQIKDRETEFHSQLKQTIEETQATARNEVTRTLLNRFDLHVSELQSKFERRLREVVDETEALSQLRLESALTEAKENLREQMREEARSEYESMLLDSENLIEKLRQDATGASTEWRAERQRLEERIASLEQILDAAHAARTEKLDEHKKLERKLAEALQSKTQLQLDLQRAVAELSSRAQSEATHQAERVVHGEVAAIVQAEMVRVGMQLDEIERKLADPEMNLGSEMRLNRDRAELQAYLKGLRYSLGEASLQTCIVEESCSV